MLTIAKRPRVNACLLLLALSGSFALGYYLYRGERIPPERAIFKGEKDDYMFSFYNQDGKKLSDLDGNLRFVTDPFTIYRNYPNQKTAKYSIDKYGFREGHTSDKPYTAIVLGGSAAFGFALAGNDKTFAAKISRSSQKYNVFNAAVVSFLSGQELSQMVHYLDNFNPSLYIVFNGWNDIYDPYAFTKSWPVAYGPIGYNNAFLMIETRLAQFFQMTAKDKNSEIEALDPVGGSLDEAEYFQKILKTYAVNISKMHSFAHSRGAGFLLVFQPELGNKALLSKNEQETLRVWGDKYEYFDRKISVRYKRLIDGAKQFFQEKSILYIDINDEPLFSQNPATVFFDVVHPNELGHDIIAQIINRVLSEKF
jgi:hypothetical protein